MSKQLFELGEKVFVFKMKGLEAIKSFGVVTIAEINSGGYIQYTVETVKDGQFLVNHASIAHTEEELKQKINNYLEYITAQKKIFEEKFGKPEFVKGVTDGK